MNLAELQVLVSSIHTDIYLEQKQHGRLRYPL